MNENEHIPIILNDVFNERKESIIHTFESIFERIFHNQSYLIANSSSNEIQQFITRIMNKYFNSEQEQFLSYLIYYISHIAKISDLKDPKFASQFYIKKKEFDEKYDKDGQLRQILQTFRSHPVKSNFPNYTSFFSLFLGFSFDATIIRSTLFELREIVDNTFKTVIQFLKNSKTNVLKIIHNSSINGDQNIVQLQRKIKLIQIQHEKEINSFQTTLNNYQMKIKELKKSQSDNQQFRLNLEGDLLQIVSLIESIEKEDLSSKTQLTLNDIKKKSSQLLTKITLTTSSEMIDDNSFKESNDCSSFHIELIHQIKEKDAIINDLKSQLHNTFSFIDENNNNNNSLPLIKPNSIDSVTKMSEIIKTSSIDLQNALKEKQNLRKKLTYYQDLQSKYESIQKERNELKEKLEEANNLKEKYQSKNKIMKQQMKENEVQFNSLIQKVSKLQKKVEQQKNRLLAAEKPLSDTDFDNFKSSLLIEEIKEKTNSLVEYELTLTQLQKENLRLLTENEMIRNTQQLEERRIKQMKENMENLNNQLEIRDEQYRNLIASLNNSNISQIEEQLQTSLDENQNLANKFNKLIKKYQDLKKISQNVLNENGQLSTQIESLKLQIKEFSKNERKQQEIISKLNNKIENLELKTFSDEEIQLLSQKYNGIFIPKENVKDSIDELASKAKEKVDQLLILETKSNQQQELITNLQTENQKLFNYYGNLLDNIRTLLSSQNEQNIPEIVKQMKQENEQLKNILNDLKIQTNSQNLNEKITDLIKDSDMLSEIRKITKSDLNQDLTKAIANLLENNETLNIIKSKLKQNSKEKILEKIKKLIQDSNQLQQVKSKLIQKTKTNLTERINSLLSESIELNEVKSKLLTDSNKKENLSQRIEKVLHDCDELNEIKSKLIQYLNPNQTVLQTIEKLIKNANELNQNKTQINTEEIKSLLNQEEGSAIIETIKNLIQKSKDFIEIKQKLIHESNSNQNLTEVIDTILYENNEYKEIRLKLSQFLNLNNNTLQVIDILIQNTSEIEEMKSKLIKDSNSTLSERASDLLSKENELNEVKSQLLFESDENENLSQRIEKVLHDCDELNEIKSKLTQYLNPEQTVLQVIEKLIENNQKESNQITTQIEEEENNEIQIIQEIKSLLNQETESTIIETIKNLIQNSNELENMKLKLTNESLSLDQLLLNTKELEEIRIKLNLEQNQNILSFLDDLILSKIEITKLKSRLLQDSNESFSKRIETLIKDSSEFTKFKLQLLQDSNDSFSKRIEILLHESNELKEIKTKLLQDSTDSFSTRMNNLLKDNLLLKEIRLKLFKNPNSTENILNKIDQIINEKVEYDELKSKLVQNSDESLTQKVFQLLQESQEFKQVKSRLLHGTNDTFSRRLNSLLNDSIELKEAKLKVFQKSDSTFNLPNKISQLIQENNEFKELKLKLLQDSNEELSQRIDNLLNDSFEYKKISIKLKENSNSDENLYQIVDDFVQSENELNQIKSKLNQFLHSNDTSIRKVNYLIQNDQEFREMKSKIISNSNENLPQRIDHLLKDSFDFNRLLTKLKQNSDLRDPFQIVDNLIQNNDELSEVKMKLIHFSNPNEKLIQKINLLLQNNQEFAEMKAQLIHESGEILSQRIDQLLKENYDFNRILSKLNKNSNFQDPLQLIDHLLQCNNELNEAKSKLIHFSNPNENFLQKINRLIQINNELNEIRSKLIQFSSNENLIQKINRLLQNDKELKETKEKLLRDSNENLSQRIDHLISDNFEYNRLLTKLKQSSNLGLNDPCHVIDSFVQSTDQLNEIRSKLSQYSNSNENLIKKVNYLIQNDQEFNEMKSKLLLDSSESLSQRIDNLLKDTFEYNRLLKQLKQNANSNSNSPSEIIGGFIQNNKELSEARSKLNKYRNENENLSQKVNRLLQKTSELNDIKSKLSNFSESTENISQKIDLLLANDQELNQAKYKLKKFPNSTDSLIQKINKLLQNDQELNELKMKLKKFSNSNESSIQVIDRLIQNDHELNEVKTRLNHFSDTNENLLSKINLLLQNDQELNELRLKLRNFSSPNENLFEKINKLLQNDQEFNELKMKLKKFSVSNETISQVIDHFIQSDNELNQTKSKLSQVLNSNETFSMVIDRFIQSDHELNEAKSRINKFSNSNEPLLQKINKLIKNTQELYEAKSKLKKFSNSNESFSQKINKLLHNNQKLNETKSKLKQFSDPNENHLQKIDTLLKNSQELIEAKEKLKQLSQKIDSLLRDQQELNEMKSKLKQFSNSNENLSQKIDSLQQKEKELNEMKSKLKQFSDPNENHLQKIDTLLKNSQELIEAKEKLKQLSQKIDSLLQDQKELNEMKSKLKQFSNSNENLSQKIDSLQQKEKELNEMKSKLKQFSNSNESFSQKIDHLLQNNQELIEAKEKLKQLSQKIESLLRDQQELNEMKSKLTQFSNSNEDLSQKIDSLQQKEKELNEMKSKLKQFSNSNESFSQKIDHLLQNNQELAETKLKMNQFSNSNENLSQKMESLLQVEKEFNEMKSKLVQQSDGDYSDQINILRKQVDEIEAIKSKLIGKSNENLIQKVDELLNDSKKLREIEKKLIKNTKSSTKIHQRIDELIKKEVILNQLKESINFDTPEEIIEKVEILNAISELFQCNNQKQLPKICSKIFEKLNHISMILDSDMNNLPEIVSKLKGKVEKMGNILLKINEMIPFNNNEELLENIKENIILISQIHELIPFNNYKQLISSLKNSISFENEIEQLFQVDNKKDAIERIREQSKDYHKLCKSLQSISFSEDNRSAISQLKEELRYSQEFMNSIQKVIPFENENDIIQKISQIIEENDLIKQKNLHYKKVVSDMKNSDLSTQNYSQQINDIENNHLAFLNELANKMKIRKDPVSENEILQRTYILQELADIINNSYPGQKNPINSLQKILEKLKKFERIFTEIHEILKFDKVTNLPEIIKEKENQIGFLRKVAKKLSLNSIEEVQEAIIKLIQKVDKSPKSSEILTCQQQQQQVAPSLIDDTIQLSQNSNSDEVLLKRMSLFEDVFNSAQQLLNINDITSLPQAIRRLQEQKTKKNEDVSQFKNLFSQLKDTFDNSSQKDDLTDTIRQMKDENVQLSKLIDELQNSLQFDRNGELATYIKELIEKHPNETPQLEKLLSRFNSLKKLDTILNEIQKLKNNFSSETEELKHKHQYFVDSITRIINETNNIEDEIEIPPAILKINNERNELQKKNADTVELMGNLKKIINFNDNQDLINEIENLTKLKKRVQKIIENINGINDIDELPQFIDNIQNEMQNATKKYSSIVKQLTNLIGEKSEIKLIAEIAKQIDELKQLEEELKRVSSSKNLKEALSKIKEAINDKEILQDLSNTLSMEIDCIPSELIKLQNQTNSLKSQLSNVQETFEIKKNELHKLKENHSSFISSLLSTLEISGKENEIINGIAELKSKNEALKKSNSSFKSKLTELLKLDDFDDFTQKISDLIQEKNDLQNELSNMNERIRSLQDDFQCDDISQVREIFGALKKSKEAMKDSHTKFVCQVASALQNQPSSPKHFSSKNESQLIESISKLRKNYSELFDKVKQKEKLIDDLKQLIQINENEELPSAIQELLSENSNSIKIAKMLNCDSKDIPQSIEQIKEELQNQKQFIQKVSESLGVSEDYTSNLMKQIEKYNDSMKLIECESINEFQSKISKIIDDKANNEKKFEEAEKKRNKLQNYLSSLKKSFSEVSRSEMSNIPSEMSNLKLENENLKKKNSEIENEFHLFKDQITDGLKMWENQSAEEIVNAINSIKMTTEQQQNSHENLIEKLRLIIRFNDEEQIPSIVEKLSNENNSMIAKLKRLSQIQQDLGDTTIDDAPQKMEKLRASLKSKSDQFENLFDQHNNLINEIKQTVHFENENEIPSVLNTLLKTAKEFKIKFEKLSETVKTALNVQDDSEIIRAINSMKKKLSKKEEAEKNFEKFIKEIQKNTNSKSVSDISSNFVKLQNQITEYSKAFENIKKILPIENDNDDDDDDEKDEDRILSSIKQILENNERIQKDDEIFESIKKIIEFDSPERIPSVVTKMSQDIEKMSKLIKSLSKALKCNSADDLPQKVSGIQNENKKASFNYDNLINQLSSILSDSSQTSESVIEKVKTLKNNFDEINDFYKELQTSHNEFVELIGRIIKNSDESSIPTQIQQIVEKTKSLENQNQSQLKTINSLKQILSVKNDETLIKTVQKLFDSTRKIKSTMSMFCANIPLSKSDSISELNTHIMSFESDFDSLRGKFDKIKSLVQVTDDDSLYDVLSSHIENHEDFVSRLLNLTHVGNEKEIVGSVQQLIYDHNSLLNELRETTGLEDPKQICLSVKQDKKKLTKAEKILGNNQNNKDDDFSFKIQKLKKTFDDLRNVTGAENEDELLSNVNSVYSTLRSKRRKSSFTDSFNNDDDFSPRKAIEEAENRNRILNELKSVSKSSDIEKMKDNMIQSKKIINELKNLLGIDNELQIIPQIKELLNVISGTFKKSFKKSPIQQIKEIFDDNKKFIDSFSKEMETNDKDEALIKLRKQLDFIENLKNVTGINDEDEILHHLNNIVHSSISENEQYEETDDDDNDNYSQTSNCSRSKKIKVPSLKIASQRIESIQNFSDKLKKRTSFDTDDEEAADKLLHSNEILNDLKKMTGIDNDDDLFSQIKDIVDLSAKNDKHKQRKSSFSHIKDSIEQNNKLMNLIQNETKINDNEKSTQKLIQAQKIINEIKKITGIESDSQIIPQIKAILNSIGNNQEEVSFSPRNRMEKMRRKVESNNKLSDSLKKLVKVESNEKVADKLKEWHRIIKDLRKLTHSEDDSQIIPQIHQIFSLFPNDDNENNSDEDDVNNDIDNDNFTDYSIDSSRSKAQKVKDSIERNQELINKIKTVAQVNSNGNLLNNDDDIDDDTNLLNSIASNKKFVDELKKITGLDEEDKIIKHIRNIFEYANVDTMESPRASKKSPRRMSQSSTASAIAENQKILNDLKKISNVDDPKQLKTIVEDVNDLKKIAQVAEIYDLKEKLKKYSDIIKELLMITGETDELMIPDQIRNIFNLLGTSPSPNASDDEDDDFPNSVKLRTYSSSEKIQLKIERNKNFVNEMMQLFGVSNIFQLREAMSRCCSIISTLKKSLQLSNDNQIYPTINNMIQILANLRSISNADSDKNIKTVLLRYTNLLSSLSSLLNISSGKDSDFLNALKKLVSIEKSYKIIVEVLHNHLTYNDEDDIPKVLNETLSQSSIDRNFVSQLFSLIEESDQVDISLDESLSANLVEWFTKYLKEADEILGDHKRFIDSAAVYGYQGQSALDASDFLIECAITRRKHEIMESAHDEIESLRKNSDAKVAIVEKRNKELTEALQKAGKAKKDAQQRCNEIQAQSVENEISLQNEINDLTTTISNYKKYQEELLRFASGETYDKDILIKYLPQKYQIMLKIM
ncbi:hypothetical protein M9Y10_009442 [Tritrichomonas musculus]|uniref:Viral A-type inclusion protein n=1 Tax=Tritrichomonas musculus TaxID=1915356 RepID=A0ABR2INJ7_9EUKA